MDETEAADGRRTGKTTIREKDAVQPLLTTKQKVLGIVGAVALLTVILGYSPFLRYWYTKTLDEAPNVSDRKAAAEALFDHWGASSLMVFAGRVDRPDPLLREAATYGMELVGCKTTAYPQVIDKLKEVLPAADAPGKLLFVCTLNSIAKVLTDSRGAEKPSAERQKSEAAAVKTIAQALVPCAQPAEQNPEVRLAAVEGLCGLRTPGVCKELVKLGSTEQGALRDKARSGIPATALPDAAGVLLKAMTSPDKDLAAVAKQGFVRVRDKAPSADLLPLLSDPMDDVRREIVDALGKRMGDDKAKQGITLALKDKLADIRVLAVTAVPRTGLAGPMTQLGALVGDPDESVRIANAETLAQLRDADSKKVLLEAFKNDLQGKTMEAYITALGKRSCGKVLSEIGIVIKLLDTNPAAEASIREALVLLTRNNVPGREEQRRAWEAAKWKAWYANITERDKIKEDAVAAIEKIKAQAKQMERSSFQALKESLEKQIETLEQCKERCKPDDTEDIGAIDSLLSSYMKVKDLLFKHASIDVRNGN
jgi:HEAT repeat protein